MTERGDEKQASSSSSRMDEAGSVDGGGGGGGCFTLENEYKNDEHKDNTHGRSNKPVNAVGVQPAEPSSLQVTRNCYGYNEGEQQKWKV